VSEIRSTPLEQIHIDLGAKMAPFAGFNMPIQYSSLVEEHHCVRNSVGVFDVSHMGEFMVEGPEALELIQHVISNDASKLVAGQAQYACLPNGKGGIVDDLLVYKIDEDNERFMLVVNASNIEKDFNWILSNNRFSARLTNISDDIGLLAVQGPKAASYLQGLTDTNLSEVGFYRFTTGRIGNIEDVIISGTGYTGAGGFELYVQNDELENLWNKILEKGKEFDLVPVGLGARDTLRLEMGYCLYGNDINDETSPVIAGLNWISKPDKTPTFIGIEHFKTVKADKSRAALVGFKMEGKRIPRHDYVIQDTEGNEIGKVTSGAMSPSLDMPIGMGYVPRSFRKAGTELLIQVGKKLLPATVN